MAKGGEETEQAITTETTIPVDQLYTNTSSSIITITEDKLEKILMKNQSALERKNDYAIPLTLGLSFLTTVLTTSFKEDFMLCSGSQLKACFALGSILSFCLAVYLFVKRPKQPTISSILKEIKNTNE